MANHWHCNKISTSFGWRELTEWRQQRSLYIYTYLRLGWGEDKCGRCNDIVSRSFRKHAPRHWRWHNVTMEHVYKPGRRHTLECPLIVPDTNAMSWRGWLPPPIPPNNHRSLANVLCVCGICICISKYSHLRGLYFWNRKRGCLFGKEYLHTKQWNSLYKRQKGYAIWNRRNRIRKIRIYL